MFTQHYFIEGKYYGSGTRYQLFYESVNRYFNPQGTFFFCPLCSRIWAEFPIEGEISTVESHVCGRHKPYERLGQWPTPLGSRYPGSIRYAYDEKFLDDAPVEVLLYEFNLALAQHANDYLFDN